MYVYIIFFNVHPYSAVVIIPASYFFDNIDLLNYKVMLEIIPLELKTILKKT